MKKFFLSILTLLYMTVSSGIAMEVHYCMGKRAGVDFYKTENEKCSRCGMKEQKGGCCSDEHKFYKLADAHKNVTNDYNATLIPVFILKDHISFSNSFLPFFPKRALDQADPPGDPGIPLFIRNRVFRI